MEAKRAQLQAAPTLWTVDTAEQVTFLAERVFSDTRVFPLMVVTPAGDSGEPRIDPAMLATQLGDSVEIAVVASMGLSQELSNYLPEGVRCYGGAVRMFRPSATREDDFYRHPLA